MPTSIPSQLQKRIDEKVSSGEYRSSEEVLAEGLRLLELRDQRLSDLRADIQLGIASLDRGEGEDAPMVIADLRAKYA